MLRLSAIWIYPVKSLAGVRVSRAHVEDRGLRDDRRFMVVEPDGRFLTQREHAPMALVRARVEGDALHLEAPGAPPLVVPLEVDGPAREVTVWADRCEATDAGERAARWLSDALGRRARLVRMPASTRRAVDARYASDGEIVSFADAFPFLLVGQGSLDALNARLEAPVDARRFRPNLIVEGAAPFAEDGWRELAIGAVRLHVRKACSRCPIVNVDPDRGARGSEPLATLATFRTADHRVLFGQNLVHQGRGSLREGDPVRLVR